MRQNPFKISVFGASATEVILTRLESILPVYTRGAELIREFWLQCG